jgi:1-acyl-sn-glycerol-3-phosphate acyltransferase
VRQKWHAQKVLLNARGHLKGQRLLVFGYYIAYNLCFCDQLLYFFLDFKIFENLCLNKNKKETKINKQIAMLFIILQRIATLIYSVTGLVISNDINRLLELNDLFLSALNVVDTSEQSSRNTLEHQTGIDSGVIVFNHPTFWDHAVLVRFFGRKISFLAKEEHVKLPFLRSIADKLGCIYTNEKKRGETRRGSVEVLGAEINNGKLIAIAPTGGLSCENECELPPFKTGAFCFDFVHPVVILYCPYSRWEHNVPLWSILWKRIISRDCIRYKVELLPKVTRLDDETVSDFAERTRKAMESALAAIVFD